MKDLIAALQIFAKYHDLPCPTHCTHDELHVVGFAKDEVSREDALELFKLGFVWIDESEDWISFRFGSA